MYVYVEMSYNTGKEPIMVEHSWLGRVTNNGNTLRDGVAQSTLTKQVVFVIFLEFYGVVPCGLVLMHLTALWHLAKLDPSV